MSIGILRFGNFVFPYNPESLTISRENNHNTLISAITVKGEFTGANCSEYTTKLSELFQWKKTCTLCLPENGALRAYISKLEYSLDSTPQVIQYSLTFTGVYSVEKDDTALYTVKRNETFFTLAKKLSCNVNTLFRLNSGIAKTYCPNEGDVIIVPLFSGGDGL